MLRRQDRPPFSMIDLSGSDKLPYKQQDSMKGAKSYLYFIIYRFQLVLSLRQGALQLNAHGIFLRYTVLS